MILICKDAGDPERRSHDLPTRGFNIVTVCETGDHNQAAGYIDPADAESVNEEQAKVTQLSTRRSTRLWADSDNHVDAADLGAGRRQRQHSDRQVVTRDVLQLAGHLTEEMVVIGRIGVEIRAARLDDDLMQKPAIGKLMQGIVDRRE